VTFSGARIAILIRGDVFAILRADRPDRARRARSWGWGAVLLIATACWLVTTERAGAQDGAVDCGIGSACRSAPESWPDQESQPFRFLGKTMDRDHPRWRNYARPIARYPGPRECLLPEQAQLDVPSLLEFDWQRPRRLSDLDVCLFRVFAALGSPEEVRAWLRHFGFQVSAFRDLGRSSRIPADQNPTKGFGAQADRETYRSLRPSMLAALIGFDTTRGFSIEVCYNVDLQLISVITSVTVE
jgi:hypothetical protein